MCSKAKSAKLRWMRRTGFSTLIEPCMMYDTCLQRRRFNSSALTAYGSISREVLLEHDLQRAHPGEGRVAGELAVAQPERDGADQARVERPAEAGHKQRQVDGIEAVPQHEIEHQQDRQQRAA